MCSRYLPARLITDNYSAYSFINEEQTFSGISNQGTSFDTRVKLVSLLQKFTNRIDESVNPIFRRYTNKSIPQEPAQRSIHRHISPPALQRCVDALGVMLYYVIVHRRALQRVAVRDRARTRTRRPENTRGFR